MEGRRTDCSEYVVNDNFQLNKLIETLPISLFKFYIKFI